MKTAVDKIKEINDITRKWVAEDPDNRSAGLMVEDAEYWAKSGIITYEDMEKYLLMVDIYEGTKDVYGYKPEWSRLNSMSKEELELEADYISLAADEKYGEPDMGEPAKPNTAKEWNKTTTLGEAFDAALTA